MEKIPTDIKNAPSISISNPPNIDKALIGFKVTVINDKKGVFHL